MSDPSLVARLALEDILDDAILSAAPGSAPYPLRAFLSALRERTPLSEVAFDVATTLNVYFRVAMEEETRMRLGIEASRVYYRYAYEQVVERERIAATSHLLAALLSTQLVRLRYEAVDGARTFDSSMHEREPDADEASSAIIVPRSFMCRVVANDMVRARARVRTG
jgi:hypothetical protein